MIQRMYAIKDTKAECFNPPFVKFTHGEAERDFKSLLMDEKSMVNKYPEDYDLYYLGDYDTISGKLDPQDTPKHIVKAAFLKPSLDQNKPLTQLS